MSCHLWVQHYQLRYSRGQELRNTVEGNVTNMSCDPNTTNSGTVGDKNSGPSLIVTFSVGSLQLRNLTRALLNCPSLIVPSSVGALFYKLILYTFNFYMLIFYNFIFYTFIFYTLFFIC